MRALALAFGPWLALSACQEASRHLAYPPVEGSWALLSASPVQPRLWILASDAQEVIEVPGDDSGPPNLAAAVWAVDRPRDLRLPEGAVALEAPSTFTRGLPLGEPETRYFEAGADGEWRERGEAPPELEAVQFRDPWICPELEFEVFEIPGTEGADGFAFGVKVSEDAVLARQGDGRLFLIDVGGGFEAVSIAGLEGGASAFAVHGEELWVGTSSGAVFRGALARPYTVQRVGAPTDAPIDRLVVTMSQGREHIMLLDRDRRLWHHDGSSWVVAHAYYADTTNDRSKDLLEIEPGHVLASSLSEPDLLRYSGGVWSVERPEVLPTSGFSRLLHVPGAETLAVATFGTIYGDQGGRWEELMTPTARINVGAWAEVGGAVLTGDLRSGLELVYPRRALACGPRTLPFTIRAEVMARLGDRVLVAGPGRRLGALTAFAVIRTTENSQ